MDKKYAKLEALVDETEKHDQDALKVQTEKTISEWDITTLWLDPSGKHGPHIPKLTCVPSPIVSKFRRKPFPQLSESRHSTLKVHFAVASCGKGHKQK